MESRRHGHGAPRRSLLAALLAGAGKGEALRQAQHELRNASVGTLRATWLNPENRSRLAAGDPAIREQPNALLAHPEETRPFQGPYYWAGFILQGGDGAGARV